MAWSRNIKVGAFVLVGLALFSWITLLVGEEAAMFERKMPLSARFDDVKGLRPGASVRMGGVIIGTVGKVGFREGTDDLGLVVEFQVNQKEAPRLREGTTASIEPKGLLGDQTLVLVPGAGKKALTAGTQLQPAAPSGLTAVLGKAERMGNDAEKVIGNLEKVSSTLAEPSFRDDVAGTAKALKGVLQSVNDGDGYLGRVLRDKGEAERLSRAVSNLEQSSAELSRLLGSLNRVVARVQEGPGFAHDVIYGTGPSETLARFGGAAEELQLTLKGVREGNGLAHGLIYGDARADGSMANVTELTRDLKAIVKDVRAGRGTIGALLTDPSVYEDLKLLLGNVQRNRTLRALVRYSIKQDEAAPRAVVADPAAPAAAPAPAAPALAAGGKTRE